MAGMLNPIPDQLVLSIVQRADFFPDLNTDSSRTTPEKGFIQNQNRPDRSSSSNRTRPLLSQKARCLDAEAARSAAYSCGSYDGTIMIWSIQSTFSGIFVFPSQNEKVWTFSHEKYLSILRTSSVS